MQKASPLSCQHCEAQWLKHLAHMYAPLVSHCESRQRRHMFESLLQATSKLSGAGDDALAPPPTSPAVALVLHSDSVGKPGAVMV
jgi:hypothetical protein